MKDIKFRCFCFIDNKMYYQHLDGGFMCNGFDGSGNCDYFPLTIRFDKDIYPGHDDIELMQFTGLFDRLGKEIYKNDLLKTIDGIFEVIYCDGRFGVERYKVTGQHLCDLYEFIDLYPISRVEVIGDIYSNPELLVNSTK